MSVIFLLIHVPCFIEIHVFSANSVDPDQTPRSAASDLGLRCFSMSFLWDARLKLVKKEFSRGSSKLNSVHLRIYPF